MVISYPCGGGCTAVGCSGGGCTGVGCNSGGCSGAGCSSSGCSGAGCSSVGCSSGSYACLGYTSVPCSNANCCKGASSNSVGYNYRGCNGAYYPPITTYGYTSPFYRSNGISPLQFILRKLWLIGLKNAKKHKKNINMYLNTIIIYREASYTLALLIFINDGNHISSCGRLDICFV